MVLVSHFSYRDVIKLLSKWPCPTSGPFVILTLNKATCTSWYKLWISHTVASLTILFQHDANLSLARINILCLNNMDRVLGSEYRWGVSNIFSILSTQRSLTHEQRLRLKTDGRPCPKVTVKYVSSDTAYQKFPWICGDVERNTYFCWPCLVMGELSKVSFSFLRQKRGFQNKLFSKNVF